MERHCELSRIASSAARPAKPLPSALPNRDPPHCPPRGGCPMSRCVHDAVLREVPVAGRRVRVCVCVWGGRGGGGVLGSDWGVNRGCGGGRGSPCTGGWP